MEQAQTGKKKFNYEEFAKKRTVIPVAVIVPVWVLVMGMIPVMAASIPFLFAQTFMERVIAVGLAPLIGAFAFLLTATLLSLPFQPFIVGGKFPRDVKHYVYGPRRIYGLCWGAVFYFTPLYFAYMSVGVLKKIMLRGFGYRGDLNVNIAPDAWIRDLPVLKLGRGVYLANRCTIGTNICLSDGSIFVDQVSMGPETTVGHAAIVGAGTILGEKVEIGIQSAVGLRVKIGNRSKVCPTAGVNHGAVIGNDVEIGSMSHIGVKVRIHDNINLAGGSCIPAGAEIRSQEEANAFFSSESQRLSNKAEDFAGLYVMRTSKDVDPSPSIMKAEGSEG